MALTGFSTTTTITDDRGNALKGVEIAVTGPNGYSSTVTTGAVDGAIRLGPLPIGDYTLTYNGRSAVVPVFPSADQLETVATNAAVQNASAVAASLAGKLDTTTASATYESIAGAEAKYARIGAAVRRPVLGVTPSFTKLAEGTGALAGGGAASTLTDTTDFALGTSSARLVTNGAGGFGQYTFAAVSPVNMSDAALRLVVKLDSYTNLNFLIAYVGDASLSNRFQVQLHESAIRTTLRVVREGEWLVLDFPRSAFTVSAGSPSWAAIENVRVAAVDTSGGAVTVRVNGWAVVPAPTALPNGAVVFTFDDSDPTQAIAKARLDLYGAPGVLYGIADSTGLPVATMKAWRDYSGWEIGIHAMSNADHAQGFAGLTTAQVRSKFDALKTWASSNGFSGDTFAWPNGDSDAVSEAVAREYVSTARGTTAGTQAPSFPNPYRVRSVNLAASASTLAQATAAIDAAKSSKAVTVFFAHKIVAASPTGSDALTATVNGAIDYAAAQSVPILTMTGALRKLGLV